MSSTMNIEDALQSILYYDNQSGVTVEELAKATATHVRSVYHFAEGQRQPPLGWVAKASEYLTKEYKDYRLAQLFLPEGYVIIAPEDVETNGSMDDELLSITEEQGNIIAAQRVGDFGKMMKSVGRVISNAFGLQAEARRKNGK